MVLVRAASRPSSAAGWLRYHTHISTMHTTHIILHACVCYCIHLVTYILHTNILLHTSYYIHTTYIYMLLHTRTHTHTYCYVRVCVCTHTHTHTHSLSLSLSLTHTHCYNGSAQLAPRVLGVEKHKAKQHIKRHTYCLVVQGYTLIHIVRNGVELVGSYEHKKDAIQQNVCSLRE
jgi:hypothetical protein